MRKYQINFLSEKKPLIIEAESFKDALESSIKRGEDLKYADLSGADLSYAKLEGADLSYAKLEGADLSGADLSYAKLSYAKLSYADLSGADLDYSTWPLWCGSLDVKIDRRIFCQLLYHTLRAGMSMDDEEVQALLNNPDVLRLANQFHRVEECGKLSVAGKRIGSCL